MKKWLILMLALVMLLSCGCSKQTAVETTGQTRPFVESVQRPPEPKPEENAQFSVEPTVSIQNLPEMVESSESVKVLKWVCFVDTQSGGENRTWNEAAAINVNQILAQLEMPYRVQFQMVTVNRYLEPGAFDWFSRPEVQQVLAEADLIYGYMDPKDRKNRLMSITEFVVGENAPLKNAVPHPVYWQAVSMEGEIYGIPTGLIEPKSSGWTVHTDMVGYLGLTQDDMQKQFWEMDEVFASAYKRYDKQRFLNMSHDTIVKTNTGSGLSEGYIPAILKSELEAYSLASCFVVDFSDGKAQVVNYLEQEDIRAFQQAAIRYKQAGYVSYGNLIDVTYSNISNESTSYLGFPLTELTAKIWPGQLTTGIAAGTRNATEAVSLLSLISEDADFRKQMFYGIEGQDYTVKDGVYKRTKRQDGSDYSLDFLSPLSYFCGLTSGTADRYANTRSPGTNNGSIPGVTAEEKMENHCRMLDSSRIVPPIAVDLTGFERQAENVKQVLRRYLPYFSFEGRAFGTYQQETTAAVYDLMLKDLSEAGAETLRIELQYQVEEWLKKNPTVIVK